MGTFEISPLIFGLPASRGIREIAAAKFAPELDPARKMRSALTKRRSA